jgi:hypothetical protein
MPLVRGGPCPLTVRGGRYVAGCRVVMRLAVAVLLDMVCLVGGEPVQLGSFLYRTRKYASDEMTLEDDIDDHDR